MRILPVPSSEVGWRRLLYALVALTLLLFCWSAFFVPGTLSYAPFTIQDDARQFLAWMPRIDDPSLMRGDLIADYFQSVSPPVFRWLYEGAAAIGIAPTVFARILPLLLMAVCAWSGWRVAMKLTRHPVAAFVATAMMMAFLIHDDSIWTATPRAFSPPLLLIFLDALLGKRMIPAVVAIFLLACLYPTTALVCFTILGLSKLKLLPRPAIAEPKKSILLMAIAAVGVLAALLPFEAETTQWKPVITVAQARQMPNLGSVEGRSTIVNGHGTIDWFCSARMGYVPEIVPCWAAPHAGVFNELFLLPMILLAWRALRASPESARRGDIIYAWALIATLGWWLVAIAFAFNLHLPSRYPQRVLSAMEWLAIGEIIGLWLVRRLDAGWLRRGPLAAAGVLALLLAVSFATPLPGLTRPSDSGAIAAIAALPPQSNVAGITEQLDFVPALTGRAALASAEHAIPYHFGYFERFSQHLADSLHAAATPDAAEVAAFMRRYNVAVYAVDPDFLAHGTIPPRFGTILRDPTRAAEALLARGPSALQRLAPHCVLHQGALVLLSGPCLAASAPQTASAASTLPAPPNTRR